MDKILKFFTEKSFDKKSGKNQLPPGFNPELYLNLNPDVRLAGCDPIEHYLVHGIKENRPYESMQQSSILDLYVNKYPVSENAFNIFENEWSSVIPGVGLGVSELFNDNRVNFFIEECGGIQGKSVLELGPLEGGHTYMLSNAGAKKIVSIESNIVSFLKCLISKNAFNINAEFLLGDFNSYLKNNTDRYDLLVASGVLYHMLDPIQLLVDMCKVSNGIGIWTQYYCSEIIAGRKDLSKKFDVNPIKFSVNGETYDMYKQSYLEALSWGGFCGGSEAHSYWITKDTLISVIENCGMKVKVLNDDRHHQNGPAITLYASR